MSDVIFSSRRAERGASLPHQAKTMIASAENDITIEGFSDILQPRDATLAKKGGRKGLALYDEIELDTFAHSALQKRRKVLLARAWEIEPGGKTARDRAAADFVETVVTALPFDKICEDLLDATLKGYAVSEVQWAREGDAIIPHKIASHEQRRFVFDRAWQLRLLTRENMFNGQKLPERKFIVHRHGVRGNNPYGLGLGARLYWATLFKRQGVSFWLTFLEKFAAPTVVGKMPFGSGEERENNLLRTLSGFSTNAAVIAPLEADISLLEAARSGAVSYEDWCNYWDKQISICVNGETLTTDLQGGGSRSAAQTHADMLEMLVDADGDLLSDTLRSTLLTWLTEYNYPGAAVPHLWRIRPANERAAAVTQLAQAKAARAREDALREVLSAAAELDDATAKAYITEFAPEGLNAALIDALTAQRHLFAAHGMSGKKKDLTPDKKDLTPDKAAPEDDAEFAAPPDAEDIVQAQLTDNLEAMGQEWDAARCAQLLAILDAAQDLENAARALMRAGAAWDGADYAAALSLALSASAYAGRDAVLQEMDGQIDFAEADVWSQPFEEQIDFFKQKAPRPSAEWTDILKGDHDRAFVVAGAKDREMLRDFQEAIQKALEEGTTLAAFRADFDQIVGKYGWSYKGERGWRTRTIFETNIRTSYMAGRLRQMRDPDVVKARPFWQYRHGVTRSPKIPRKSHRAWHGLILRHDDEFWKTHLPPNDWKCSCGVRTLSHADLARLDKSGPDAAPDRVMETRYDPKRGYYDHPAGIGYGWDYAPGDLWEQGLVPSQLARLAVTSMLDVDAARPLSEVIADAPRLKAKELPKGRATDFYLNAFLKPFGATPGAAALFKDQAGGAIPISDGLFKEADGSYKIFKRGREVHAAQLAETIRDPDEIWVGLSEIKIPEAQGGGTEWVVDRKYIRVDPKTGFLAVFELLKGQWVAKTAFRPARGDSIKSDVNAIDKRRAGVLVYAREK